MAATGYNIQTTKDTISFRDQTTGVASIFYDHSTESLVISHDGTGALSFGDTASDVYIGDGVNSIDMIFEVDGAIKGDTDVTLTLGSTDSDILIASPTLINNDLDVTGTLDVTGSITMTGATVATQSWVTSQNYITTSQEEQDLNSVLVQGNTSTLGIDVGTITGDSLDIQSASADTAITLRESSDSGLTPSAIYLDRSRGSSLSSPTAIQSLNYLGGVFFRGHDGTDYETSSYIQARAVGNFSSSNLGANLGLFTTASNETTPYERLTIYHNGNVGIGATSPSAGLQVGNSVSGETKTVIFNSEGGTENGLLIKSRTNRAKLSVADNDTSAYMIAEGGTASFGMADTATTTNISVKSDGDVGIGTIAPTTKLHIEGTTPILQIRETSSSAEAGISINHSVSGFHYNWFIGTLDGNARKLTIGSTVTDGHSTDTAQAAASLFLIDQSTGNVGIGTASPDSLLEIENGPATQTQSRMLNLDNNPSGNQGSGYIEISSGSNSQAKTQIEQVSSGGYGLLGNQYIDTNIINRGLSASAHGNINFATGSDTSATSIVMTIGGGSQKGYVGIGTVSPASKLHINGGALQVGTSYQSDMNGGKADFSVDCGGTPEISFISNYLQIGGTDQNWAMKLYTGTLQTYNQDLYITAGGTGTTNKLRLGTNGQTSTMVFDDGNVGIGTTSPSRKLHVSTGNGDTAARFENTTSNGTVVEIYTSGDNKTLTLQSDHIFANTAFHVGSDSYNTYVRGANIGIGTTSPATKLHVAGTVRVSGTNDLDIYSDNTAATFDLNSTARGFLFTNGNGDLVTIDSSGRVGIGVTPSSAELEVNGHFMATTKSFIIDNPKTGGKLQYGVVESDQHSVLVRGKNDTNDIELPEEWEWLVDPDSITVHLTSIGQIQQLFVISQDNKKIKIGGLATNGQYNYTVYGERVDVDKLQVNV